jgi:hypothetical protein
LGGIEVPGQLCSVVKVPPSAVWRVAPAFRRPRRACPRRGNPSPVDGRALSLHGNRPDVRPIRGLASGKSAMRLCCSDSPFRPLRRSRLPHPPAEDKAPEGVFQPVSAPDRPESASQATSVAVFSSRPQGRGARRPTSTNRPLSVVPSSPRWEDATSKSSHAGTTSAGGNVIRRSY